MVRDALEGDRLIGMVLLRPGWEDQYEGRPPVYETGTAGAIVRSKQLPDGRYNIILHGRREFTIDQELDGRSYRRAEVTWRSQFESTLDPTRRERISDLVREYLDRRGQADLLPDRPQLGVSDATFVGFIAQHVDLVPVERLGMLQAPTLAERADRLIASLEFQLHALRSGGPEGPERPQ